MKNSIQIFKILLISIAITGCATQKIDPSLLSIADDQSNQYATIYSYSSYRGSSYYITDSVGCTKKWNGVYTPDSHQSTFKKYDKHMDYIKVKANKRVSILYVTGNSYQICYTGGTILTKAGSEYFVFGHMMDDKCTFRITDKKTNEPINLVEAEKKYSGLTCKP